MNTSIQKYLNQFFSAERLPISPLEFHPVGGGSINDTYQLILGSQCKFFLKVNSAAKYPKLFQKEKKGLEFLNNQSVLHIPAVILCNEIDNYQVLVLEWIEEGVRTEHFWKKFGEQLASLHRVTNQYFGFEEDNYMGALPQRNDQYGSWVEFFVRQRLQPQIELATENHLLLPRHLNAFENLYQRLENLFNSELPSLLHGDLWSGNFMCDHSSEPTLIDPAVYFGHRSMDLGMTTLFGGFKKSFYESYNYHFALPDNYDEQWEICNLYPLLIHLNLFGQGYLRMIERTLNKFE